MEVLEEWRDVVGYEGLYAVSNLGRVRNSKGLIRKQKKDRYGYMILSMARDGIKKHPAVHRLVWEAFNGTIPEGMQIDHINTVRDDNRIENLRVVSSKDNQNNSLTLSHLTKANRRSFGKSVLQLDKDTGEVIREWECIVDAERELGINHRHISKCCLGKRKTTGGYRWRFALANCS